MSPRFAIWSAVVLVTGAALLGVGQCGYKKLQALNSLASIEALVDEDFPEVTQISTADLAELQKKSATDPTATLLVIDTRKPKEYAVSRIPGAVNLQTADEVTRYLEKSTDPPARIAVYCSVGYRSSKLAKALQKRGVDNIVNVRGSIFRWANEDRPLEKPDGTPATQVHPYADMWAKFLKPGKATK